MDNDDELIGTLLSRRDAVTLLAMASAGLLVGCDRSSAAAATPKAAGAPAGTALSVAPNCVVRPELTVGPYFVDKQLERSDIRADVKTNALSAGAPLVLSFLLADVTGGRCAPLANAVVDVWHCDAAGKYSGVNDPQFGDTSAFSYLRGYQRTDANGLAKFTTVFPGWYDGRAVHIHFKIRTQTASQQAYEFTSQLFFDEGTIDAVHARAPYASKGRRTIMNATDGIYQSVGDQMVVAVAPASDQLSATFGIGLDLSNVEVGKPDMMGGPGDPFGPGGPGGPPPGGRRSGGPPPRPPVRPPA
jgi:protocatechuate 3,4-dioxygenase beta subunit